MARSRLGRCRERLGRQERQIQRQRLEQGQKKGEEVGSAAAWLATLILPSLPATWYKSPVASQPACQPTMLSRGSPLTPARIPPFQLQPTVSAFGATAGGLQPSEGDLPHCPRCPRSPQPMIPGAGPGAPGAVCRGPTLGDITRDPADPSWSLDQPEILRTPPHGRFRISRRWTGS